MFNVNGFFSGSSYKDAMAAPLRSLYCASRTGKISQPDRILNYRATDTMVVKDVFIKYIAVKTTTKV